MPSVSCSVQLEVSTQLDAYIEKHGLRSRTHAIQKLLEIEKSTSNGDFFTCKKCNAPYKTPLEKRHDLMEMSQ
jgi:RNA polymerase-binding transcription factor DksA